MRSRVRADLDGGDDGDGFGNVVADIAQYYTGLSIRIHATLLVTRASEMFYLVCGKNPEDARAICSPHAISRCKLQSTQRDI